MKLWGENLIFFLWLTYLFSLILYLSSRDNFGLQNKWTQKAVKENRKRKKTATMFTCTHEKKMWKYRPAKASDHVDTGSPEDLGCGCVRRPQVVVSHVWRVDACGVQAENALTPAVGKSHVGIFLSARVRISKPHIYRVYDYAVVYVIGDSWILWR